MPPEQAPLGLLSSRPGGVPLLAGTQRGFMYALPGDTKRAMFPMPKVPDGSPRRFSLSPRRLPALETPSMFGVQTDARRKSQPNASFALSPRFGASLEDSRCVPHGSNAVYQSMQTSLGGGRVQLFVPSPVHYNNAIPACGSQPLTPRVTIPRVALKPNPSMADERFEREIYKSPGPARYHPPG